MTRKKKRGRPKGSKNRKDAKKRLPSHIDPYELAVKDLSVMKVISDFLKYYFKRKFGNHGCKKKGR